MARSGALEWTPFSRKAVAVVLLKQTRTRAFTRARARANSFSVTIDAIDGYGPRNPAAFQRVPAKHIVAKGKLKKGQVVSINTDQGMRTVVVAKVGRHTVDVDTNHPLAGKTLRFDIQITDVRPATEEELAHGHAHGPGGHHH